MTVYGNTNYGRHLPDFSAALDNLTSEQEAFMDSGMFAQSMSGNPYSCVALDIWIETTMNKGSKMKAGWLAILNNEKQLLTNSRNANNVNRIRSAVHRHANQTKKKVGKHADCYKPRCKADERAVQDLKACLDEFQCDPFDPTDTTLRSLQSGLSASEELVADVMSAKADGEHMVKEFLDERVFAKKKSLSDRIPRSIRLNFANQEVKAMTGATMKGKAQEMERVALASVIELVDKSGALKLEDVLEHRVTEECLSIFNVNGTMRKTQKSKLLQTMNISVSPIPTSYTVIVDMGLIWRLSCPNKEDREKEDGSPFTWGDYAEKLIKLILKRHESAERIICVNDNYSQRVSIKDSERMLRQANKQVANIFIKADKQFPNSMEFNNILVKSENKNRLQAFLKSQLKKTAHVVTTEIIHVVVGESAENLTKQTQEDDFLCTHCEADTAIFTIYNDIRGSGYLEPVIIDTEDTDNYVQAAYVANKVNGILLLKQKNRLIDAKCLIDSDMTDCIVPLHAITGCDHTSGFYGIGKIKVTKRVKKSPDARKLLSACGENIMITDDDIQKLTKFVIKYIYSDYKSKTIAEARASRWKQQKRKSLIRMIPDMDSLIHHIKRANYIAYIQKNFSFKDHPSPLDKGWHMENGVCLPTRSRLPSLPPSVTMAMPYLRDAHTVHEHDDDNISYEDSEEFPYVASDEEDVYIYSDDDSILSDASTS